VRLEGPLCPYNPKIGPEKVPILNFKSSEFFYKVRLASENSSEASPLL
jgi:hypothetical protein